MFNWRARVGYILPGQSVEAYPRDFWRMAPPGVSLVISFAGMREIDANGVNTALSRIQCAAEELRDHGADIVHIGGLPMVTQNGVTSERPLVERLKEWSGGRLATTDFAAQMYALRALGARKVVQVSPNMVPVTETYTRGATDVGVQVLHTECLNSLRCGIPLLTERQIYQACAQAFRAAPDAQAIWAPCGNFMILDLIKTIEADFGVPVVTSNQAALWWDLVLLKIDTHGIEGYGQLFQANVCSMKKAEYVILEW